MNPSVHIVRGLGAAESVRLAGIHPDRILVDQDCLSCGPVPSLDDPYEWTRRREAFWRSVWGSAFSRGHSTESLYLQIVKRVPELQASKEIILWLGSGLDEHLLFCWTMAVLHQVGIDPRRLRIPLVNNHLSPAEQLATLEVAHPSVLASDHECREPTEQDIGTAHLVWTAISADSPELLASLMDDFPDGLPGVRRSLDALVQRFPDVDSGLSTWDSRLLHLTERSGRRAALIVGRCIIDHGSRTDQPGDRYLFWRLRKLGDPGLRRPLLTLEGEDGSFRNTRARLTTFGKAVLEGEANHVEVNGVDEWIGGIHLDSSRKQIWWNHDGRLTGKRTP